jgi:hypothetical protein
MSPSREKQWKMRTPEKRKNATDHPPEGGL